MQPSSFWPPRRSVDRFAAELYRRRHVDEPWLTRQAIRLLPTLLNTSDRVLEWGSGTSTAWLGRRVDSLLSVEHDPQWCDRVATELRLADLSRASVVLLSTAPENDPSRSPYVRAVDRFGDGECNVCVVDGEHRAACALEALAKLADGGLLVIDDVHQYLDHASPSPHSRQGRGPVDGAWARFATAVSDWRMIWTSDGYSDTAFWFKP